MNEKTGLCGSINQSIHRTNVHREIPRISERVSMHLEKSNVHRRLTKDSGFYGWRNNLAKEKKESVNANGKRNAMWNLTKSVCACLLSASVRCYKCETARPWLFLPPGQRNSQVKGKWGKKKRWSISLKWFLQENANRRHQTAVVCFECGFVTYVHFLSTR